MDSDYVEVVAPRYGVDNEVPQLLQTMSKFFD